MTEFPSHTAPAADRAAVTSQVGGGWLRRAVWPCLIAGLIVCASSRSQVVAPGITRMDDKFGHFAVYGLLATLVCRLGAGKRAAIGAFMAVAAFGAIDEWHQSFVPGRSADFKDWIADTLGAATAIALYRGWKGYRRCLERPLWPHRERLPANGANRRG